VTLSQFLDEVEYSECSLVVVNRTEPDPFRQMLENLFVDQSIEVSEDVDEDLDENTVVLVEDGEVVARSPLAVLNDAILLVNSDLYSTGTLDLTDTTVPAVIDGLTDSRFRLRGFPKSNSEKLLLILISRHIERLAYETGGGTLRSSFQQLSRITDERGTRQVYQKVAGTTVDVHVYGQPDWTPTPDFPVTAHSGYKEDFRTSWFVVYTPEDASAEQAALLAIETEPQVWEGFWTYDPTLVSKLSEYIRRTL
jgi:hypothetical protein